MFGGRSLRDSVKTSGFFCNTGKGYGNWTICMQHKWNKYITTCCTSPKICNKHRGLGSFQRQPPSAKQPNYACYRNILPWWVDIQQWQQGKIVAWPYFHGFPPSPTMTGPGDRSSNGMRCCPRGREIFGWFFWITPRAIANFGGFNSDGLNV